MEEIVKNEFLFYAKLAKPLVLNLPKSKDRILAAAWIKKFGQESAGTEKLRISYLKLLLFCLQRRKLTGIFADNPSFYEFLEELPEELDLNDFARNLLEQEATERKAVIRMEMMGDMENFPAYTTDCSTDLTEYVAAQDIPNFGVHAYYAISKQPVNKWQRPDKAILPKGTKSFIDTSITAAPAAATSICVCTPKGTASAPQVEEGAAVADCLQPKDKTPSPDQKKKRRPQKFGKSPPTHPIGEVKHSTEDRLTPTWGTNLLEVRENIDIGHIDEPSDAAKALDKEVSQLIQDAEEEEEDQLAQETVASKAKDMLNTIDEFSRGKMDKPKKKPPSRIGDTSRIKPPKSLKQPKIAVKGMKKKGAKKGPGPRPANLPEEFADLTEKELEEAGLTWNDLMPIGENMDDELQQIEDEEMRTSREEDVSIDEIAYTPYEDLDLDAMIREAEADLQATAYEAGVEADENAVELLADEMYDIQDEINASAAIEEARAASPAIASGIPVTTPQRSPSPRRSKSPEAAFDGEDDALLRHRASPLRAPRICSSDKKKKRKSPRKTPPQRTDKDPNISRVYEQAHRVAMDDSFLEHEREFEELDEFERLERETASPGRSPLRGPSPARGVSFSPGDADRVRQRAWEQEQLLRSPQEQIARSPPRQMMRTPERTDRVMDEFDLGGMSPFRPAESPPQMTQQERYEMMKSLRESPGEDSSLGLLSPSVLRTPPGSSGEDSSLGLLSPSVLQSPQEHVPGRMPPFLMGSPIANRIIGEASNIFADDPFATRRGEYLDDVTPPRDLSMMSASPGPSDYHSVFDESLGVIPPWDLLSDELVPGGDLDDRAIFERFAREGAPPRAPSPARTPIRQPSPARSPVRQPSPAPSPPRAPSPIRIQTPSPRPPPTPPPMPFFPGISAPITPIRQRPIPRPSWYGTPRPRIQTPQKLHGPERRPYYYYSPEPPLIDPFDPLAYQDQTLLDEEEEPEAFGEISIEKPKGAKTPRRRRPPPLPATPISRRPEQALRPRRILGTPSAPCRVSPSRSPAELEEFERIESSLRAASPGRQEQPLLSMVDVSAQEAAARIQEMARQQDAALRTPEPPKLDRRKVTPIPPRSPSPVLDRRKVISTPPRPPKYVPPMPPVQLWKTPEGVAGPSRRRTGFTPPVVCPSDCTPSPSPVLSPRFPPARRIVKKGVYPPSPKTPSGERYMPSPYVQPAQRLPPHGTPGRGDPFMMPRRLFDTPGRSPVRPTEESPILYSPSPKCSPIVLPPQFDNVPLLDAESPPYMPPSTPEILKEGQLYFPRQDVLPTATPERLPTREEIERHQVVPDHLHARISQRTPFGRGPGRYIHRESVRAFQPMDRVPEYADHWAHVEDRTFEDRLHYPMLDNQPVKVKVPKYYEPLPRDFPSPRPQPPMDITPPYTDTIREILTMSPPPERGPASYYPDVVQSTEDFIRAVQRYDLPQSPCPGSAPARQPRPSGIRPPSGRPLRPSGLRPPSTGPQSRIRPPPPGTPQQALPQFGPQLATPDDQSGRTSVPQDAPVKTAPTRRVAEPGRQKVLFSKIQLRETKSTTLRKEALAKQKAAELEAQKKKERAAQARKNRKKRQQTDRLREIVTPQMMEAEAAAARQAAAREAPDPEFMDSIQRHEVAFPDLRRGVMVQGRWKPVPRRSETGFQQMDQVHEEPASPCGPCDGGDAYQDTIRDLRLFDRPEPQMRRPMELTQQQKRMRLDQIEQNLMAREREEEEYFEQLQREERARAEEEEELAEFEALERQFLEEEEAAPQPCPGAAQFPARRTPPPCATLDAESPPMFESPPPMFGLDMISPPPFFDADRTPSPQRPGGLRPETLYFTPPEDMEFYDAPAGASIHPGEPGIMDESPVASLFYSPPQYPPQYLEPLRRQRDIEQWQPPRAMMFDHMPSPGELYSPEESLSLGLLNESMLDSVAQGIISPPLEEELLDPRLLDNVDQEWITTPPARGGPTEQIQDYMEPNVEHYAETPRRNRQGVVRSLMEELDQMASPPTPGTPPPQFPEPQPTWLPGLDEVEQVEREMDRSLRREPEFEERIRRDMAEEAMRREAERQEMEFRQPYSPVMSRPQLQSPPRTPVGHPRTPTRPPPVESACDTGTCNVAEPEPMQTYVPGEGWPPGLFSPQDSARRRQEEAAAQRWLEESDYNPPAPQLPTTPENLSDYNLDYYLSPQQLSPWEQLEFEASRAPNLLDESDPYQSPQPMTQRRSPCTPQNISDEVLEFYETPPQLSPWEQLANTAARSEMLDDVYLDNYQSPPQLESPCSPRPRPYTVGDQRGRRDTPGAAFDPNMEQRQRPQQQQTVTTPHICAAQQSVRVQSPEMPQQQQTITTPHICAAQQSVGGLVPRPSMVQQRQTTPQQVEAEDNRPRRVVRKTSSFKKIQTKRK